MNNAMLDPSDTWWTELEAMWEAGKRASSRHVRGVAPLYSPKDVEAFLEAVFSFPTIHEIAKRKLSEPEEQDSSESYRGNPEKVKKDSSYSEASITSFFLQWFVLKHGIDVSPYYFDSLLFHIRKVLRNAPNIDISYANNELMRALEEKKCLKS